MLSNTKLDDNHAVNQHGGSYSPTYGNLGSRYATKGVDKFGRYHFIQFYGRKHHLRIYTIYRPVQYLDSSKSDTTVWADQRYVLQLNKINIEPRTHIITSLCEEVKQCLKNNTQVLILGDVNEDIFSPQLNSTFLQAGLFNAVNAKLGNQHNFRTYSLGSKIIDGAWASKPVLEAISSLAYAPFQYIAASDHRPLIIDINLKLLLDDHFPTLTQSQYRRLKSTIPKRVNLYVEKLLEKWDMHNMSLKVEQIEQLFA